MLEDHRVVGLVSEADLAGLDRFVQVHELMRPDMIQVTADTAPADPAREGAYAMSAPAYDLKRRQVWYSDGNSGFYVVRLAKSIVPRHYWD